MFNRTDEEMQQYIAEQKRFQAIREAVEIERLQKIVDCENMMTNISNTFLLYLKEKEKLLIGKKLYNNNGIGQYFQGQVDFFKQQSQLGLFLLDSFYIKSRDLHLRCSISGGNYQPENSYYCDYIDRVLYNVIECDKKGICIKIREEPSGFPVYTLSGVQQAQNNIKSLQKEIDVLKGKIYQERRSIPDYLNK